MRALAPTRGKHYGALPLVAAFAALCCALLPGATQGAPHPTADLGKLPLHFEQNLGQADPGVPFLARGPRQVVFLSGEGASIVLPAPAPPAPPALLRLRISGADPGAPLSGERPLPGVVNSFIGPDPALWCAGIPTYGAVRAAGVLPGVDVLWYGREGRIEHDFILAPGVEAGAVTFRIEGAEALSLDDGTGDLVLALSGGGSFRLLAPVAREEQAGERRSVPCAFALLSGGRIGFTLGAPRNPEATLVIDPVLSYSTFLGGSGTDSAAGVAVDSSGNILLAGVTASVNFPVVSAYQISLADAAGDAFVAKISPTGTSLVYATYLGGTGADRARALAVDSLGNAWIAGETASANFPRVASQQAAYGGGTSDAFYAKLSPNGRTLLVSSPLGGSGADTAIGIALDPTGAAYVAGRTDSANFPVTSGAFQSALAGASPDAFVAKVPAAGGALVYGTYLGGTGFDAGNAIAVDSAGQAVVCGETNSTDFPRGEVSFQSAYGGGTVDAFVTQLAASGGSIVLSTYLGGSDTDVGAGVALDPGTGEIVVVGSTRSPNFPEMNSFQSGIAGTLDAFVTRMNPAGTSLVFSSYFGGSGDDAATSVAVGPLGNIFFAGTTTSTDLPALNAVQYSLLGPEDAFAAKFSAAGTRLYSSTYLGGSGTDYASAIAVDTAGAAYVAGVTASSDFPVQGSLQAFGGSTDAFLSKLPVTGSILVAPDQLFFGNVPPGGSLAYDIAVWNAGEATVTVSGMSFPTGSPFQVSRSTDPQACPSLSPSLLPGDGCLVNVAFLPTAAGTYTSTLSVLSDDPETPFLSIPATGIATSAVAPAISVSPTSLDFGSVQVGQAGGPFDLAISNTGGATLNVTGMFIEPSTAPYSLSTPGTTGYCATTTPTLTPGTSCKVSVAFQPTAAGTFAATATIFSNDATASPFSVSLTGVGTAAPIPRVGVSPGSADFGAVTVGSASPPTLFTLQNTGTGNLVVSNIRLTDAVNYSLSLGAAAAAASPRATIAMCGTTAPTLAPGGVCGVEVTFAPQSAGSHTGSLSILSNDPNYPTFGVPLFGTGSTAPVPVTISRAIPGALTTIPATNAYRMVGIPVIPTSPDLFSALTTAFGGVSGPGLWRAFRLSGTTPIEVTASGQDSVAYGKGWWLIAAAARTLSFTGVATVLDQSVAVSAGYQMIGAPFADISVPWTDVLADSTNLPLGLGPTLYRWDGSGNYTAAASLDPGEACWVFVQNAGTLRIPRAGGALAVSPQVVGPPPPAFTQPPPPLGPGAALSLLSPRGGELLRAGKVHLVEWRGRGIAPTGFLGTVELRLSTDGGATWKTVARGLAEAGAFPWVVPRTASGRSLLRVVSTLYPTVGATSPVFSIGVPVPPGALNGLLSPF